MPKHLPYELTRWESVASPSLPLLSNMLQQQSLQAVAVEWIAGYKTEEQELETPTTYVMVSGVVSFAFPGYGSFDLKPGDILEVFPKVRHNVSVYKEAATLLQASPAGTEEEA
jgi:hypothetical protein